MAYEYDRFDDEAGGGGFMMGLIAGAVLGVGLGMLLAPKAGSELRGQLGDTATRLRDRASEGYTAASSKVADMYNRRAGQTGQTGSMASDFQSTGSYAGGTAGTSGFGASGVDTPSTSSEF